MRVALAMIARSADAEHKDLALSLDSAKAAGFTDLVIAVDDRSHENTVEWVRGRWGENVDPFTFVMEADGDPHFANARNLTLPRIPKECEWWGWMDSDDVIESVSGQTIPEMLATLKGEVGALAFTYHYADDEYGNAKGHLKVRLFRTSVGWKWRDRVHEDCEPTGGKRMGLDIVVVQDGEEKEFRWVHHSENKVVQPGRNFRCLRRMIADDPDYPRAWFYLANQHFAAHNWRLAAEAYERYVPMSGWDEERWWALVYAAIAYRALGDNDTAIDRDLEAHSLLPNLADAYFGLGESYCRKGEWENAIRWGELGLERLVAEDKGSPQSSIPSNRIWFNANAYQFQPYTWLAVAYNNIGQPEKSLSCYEQAYRARPEEEIAKNIALLKAALDRRRVTHNGIDLAAGLAKNGEPLKALNVLASLPAGSDDDPNVLRMRGFIQKQVEHLRDRTAYQNFYFAAEEFNDPLDEGTTDEALEKFVPRMMWALRRLKAVGAKRVLDIGIGDGTFAFLLARHGIQVVGIDVDWRRAQNANKNAVRAGYQSEKTIDIEPLIEFSGDCACEEQDTAHGFEGCKAEGCVCEAKWVETQAGSTLTVPEATPDSMAQFLYCPPDQITTQIRALAPYDAVVGMELIEHVQDPEQTLTLLEEMAPRILLSTPDGGWNGPIPPNPGHVRAYSQRDLTRLVISRGWPTEMHVIQRSENEQGQIVVEYVREMPVSDERVVMFCPPTGQQWTPDSIRTGIGGSETAVIRVAEEFVKLGKRVTVFAECEGIWAGVRYRYAQDFRPEPTEIFISWRTIGPCAQMREFSRDRYVWSHDIHFGDSTPEQLKGVTVIALSNFHRTFLESRYPGAVVEVLGNGIDPERFPDLPDLYRNVPRDEYVDKYQRLERVPHRLIWAHSPDRGLDRVLALFPRIRARYPDATLEVFYGFDMARAKRPDFIADIERAAHQQPGVTLHGRVGQDRLAEEYLKADALVYPAVTPDSEPFPETYCISVVEALAGGCFPITADHGALRDTNHGGAFFRLPTMEHEVLFQLFAFWDRSEKEQSRIRDHGDVGWDRHADGGRRWALRQTWTSVAERWIALGRVERVEATAE